MEIFTIALLFLIFVMLSVGFGQDSRPSEHDYKRNW
jgi:hypothetical protein